MTADGALSRSILPCRRRVDDLLEQVAAGRAADFDGHQADCPHCQAALVELDEVWMPIRHAAADHVGAPADLVAGVMERIHTLARGIWFTFERTDGGAIRVATRIVARIARDTARQVPGVRVALGRSTESTLARLVEKATFGHRHPHAAVGVLGRTASVDLALAVTYGEAVHEVARDVQAAVIRELRESIGLSSVTVNVTVDDVLER